MEIFSLSFPLKHLTININQEMMSIFNQSSYIFYKLDMTDILSQKQSLT